MDFVTKLFNNVTVLLYKKLMSGALDWKVIKNFSKSIAIKTTNDKYGTVNFDFKHFEICL